jgi:hypothetical protein
MVRVLYAEGMVDGVHGKQQGNDDRVNERYRAV